eukprot:7172482-Prymnesium_polylepis.2
MVASNRQTAFRNHFRTQLYGFLAGERRIGKFFRWDKTLCMRAAPRAYVVCKKQRALVFKSHNKQRNLNAISKNPHSRPPHPSHRRAAPARHAAPTSARPSARSASRAEHLALSAGRQTGRGAR